MLLTELVASLHIDGDAHVLDDVPQDWTQGRTLFGGLQAALLVRAMRAQVEPGLPLRTLQTTFVGPVFAGRLAIRCSVLRIGKSAVHVEGRILDGDHVLCTALAVFGRARESMLVIAPPRPVVPLDADRSKQMPWAGDAPPKFTQHVEQRWASGAFPFCGGAEPRTQIYVRYRNEPEVDESLVIAMADTIPSPAISMLHSFAPASSLSWTLELLTDRWPRNGGDWWLVDAEATAARDGYAFQTATMWSADGKPIALSRQSAVVFG